MAITVPVDIDFQIKKALDDANELADVANRSLAGIEKKAKQTGFAINSIAFIEITRAAVDFGRVIVDVFSKAIDEAIEADAAVQSLSSSLKSAGDFSEQNVSAFEDLAKALSEVSRFSDEAVLGAFKIGKQFGLTNRETAKFGKAAVDLATFLGQDLDTTARQLGQTFDGTAGRLAEQVPALKNVSAAALKAGGALDVVIKAAGGAGQRDLDKFGTQVIKLQQAFGDIFEELGAAVVKNPAVIEGLKIITALFKEIGTAVGENNEIFKTFVSGSLSQMIKGLYVVSQVVEAINNAFFKLAKFLEPAVQALESFDKATEALKKGDIRGFTRSLDIVTATRDRFKEIDKLAERDAKIFDKFNTALADVEGAIERAGVSRSKVNKELKAGFDGQINQNRRILESEADRLKLMKEQIKLQDEFFKKREDELSKISKDPSAALFGSGTSDRVKQRLLFDFDELKLQTSIVGGLGQVLQGRNGAVNLIAAGAEAAGKFFLGIPGFGELSKLLAQGPDEIKKAIEAFADAIPDIVVAIAESIPVVLETLADKLPDIIEKLAEKSDRIALALAKSMPLVAIALSKSVVEGARRFVSEILRGAGEFIGKILEGAGRFIEELVNKIGEAIQRLIDNLNPVKGIGNGVGSQLGSISGNGIGGSIGNFLNPVGAVAGRGVQAVADTVSNFLGFGKTGGFTGGGFTSSAIAGGGGNQQAAVVKVQIGQRDLATAILDLNRQGFRT